MLTYLSVHLTAAVEISTALRPRNDGGDRWLIPFRPGAAVLSDRTAQRQGRRSLRGDFKKHCIHRHFAPRVDKAWPGG